MSILEVLNAAQVGIGEKMEKRQPLRVEYQMPQYQERLQYDLKGTHLYWVLFWDTYGIVG